MPWQGEGDNLIDRFDVRAHLDVIPEVKGEPGGGELLTPQEELNASLLNYERYRILIQNEASKSKPFI